ncbi:N-6 DNA methylase [Myxococcus sp. K38C18041901]|uniref:N-6 DNA methylase n=1 Tax=Myxococcus guangdongensis TaxID=2906760 RepID=UPI0020A6F443|nr:N-6 DNA methylase [Myxococcus guangdongensis]MCP3065413.1 N-6 DNA methylase [Myxococcus guangdongensis]
MTKKAKRKQAAFQVNLVRGLMNEFLTSGESHAVAQMHVGALLFFKWLSDDNDSSDAERVTPAAALPPRYRWDALRAMSDDQFGSTFLERIVPYLASYAEGRTVRAFFAQRFATPRDVAAIGRARGRLAHVLLTKLSLAERQSVMEGLVSSEYVGWSPIVETSAPLRQIISAFVKPTSGNRVLDLGCGTGALLGDALVAASADGFAPGSLEVHGIDVSESAVTFARLRLALLGAPNAELRVGDVGDISFQDWIADQKFDVVLADVPFSSTVNGLAFGAPDETVRFPSNSAEVVFSILAAEALSNNGVAAVVVPYGFLFSLNMGMRIVRERLVREYGLRRVIGLSPGFLGGPAVKPAVLIFHGRAAPPFGNIWFHQWRTSSRSSPGSTEIDAAISRWKEAEGEGYISDESFTVELELLGRDAYVLEPEHYAPKREVQLRPWPQMQTDAAAALECTDKLMMELGPPVYKEVRLTPLHTLLKRSRGAAAREDDPAGLFVTPADIEPFTGSLRRRRSAAEAADRSSTIPFAAGDILFLRLNPGLGKVLVADSHGVASSDFIVFQLLPGVSVSARYIAAVLRSEPFRREMERAAHGLTLKRVTSDEVLFSVVPIPADHHQVIEKISRLSELQASVARLSTLVSEMSTAEWEVLFKAGGFSSDA